MRIMIMLFILTITLFAQDYKLMIDEKYNEPMLVGEIDRSALIDSNFSYWFNPEFEEYTLDKETLDKIGNLLDDKDITIVMGTWCGDSQREVPRFFKILDYLNYDSERVYLVAVNRSKTALDNEVEGSNLELVPTFIFYDGEDEIGRIIESPAESLEIDMLNILKK